MSQPPKLLDVVRRTLRDCRSVFRVYPQLRQALLPDVVTPALSPLPALRPTLGNAFAQRCATRR